MYDLNAADIAGAGLAVIGGWVLAQLPQAIPPVVPHADGGAVGLIGVFTGVTGLLTLAGNMVRAELQERRAHELKKLALTERIDHWREVCQRQQDWIETAAKRDALLPPAPVLPREPNGDA